MWKERGSWMPLTIYSCSLGGRLSCETKEEKEASRGFNTVGLRVVQSVVDPFHHLGVRNGPMFFDTISGRVSTPTFFIIFWGSSSDPGQSFQKVIMM